MSSEVYDTAMRLTFRHRLCDGDVEGVMREVVLQPGDPGWPAKTLIRVPFCAECQRLVPVHELVDVRTR